MSAEIAQDLPFGKDRSLRAGASVGVPDGVRREAVSVAFRVRF